MLKVYLETTIFNRFLENGRDYNIETQKLFDKISKKEMGIIPIKFRVDGIHIAMAAIYDMDCIMSLNFHHINKLKTKMATEIIHRMKGYNNPFICTPMEVIENE
jgi:hypothetical protein